MSNEDLSASKPDEVQSDPDAVMLYGSALVDRLTYISATFSSLVMSMGRAARDDRDVLVPLVEVKFDGPAGQDDTVPKTFFGASAARKYSFRSRGYFERSHDCLPSPERGGCRPGET